MTDSLKSFAWKRFLRAPDAQLLDELYVPALSRAVRYDRCCAYFSSRVLAVAARGFGGLIEALLAHADTLPRPAVRLLVNEQLDAKDRDALLAAGDQSGLIDHLLKQFKTPQTALERNRLEMLAWLTVSGWLDVRVGVMKAGQGIVHAKFGIIRDLHGDALAFMGSDNETGAALTENYEELEVRPAWQDADFVANYQQRFDALWENRDAYVATLPLPDAVRARLITFAPAQPPRELRQDRQAAATAMLWRYIGAAAYLPNGEYACDATALVDLWPHQQRVVEDTARGFPAGRLLCDEVGMGKTIEAILVLRRLLGGRGVQRALLLVPAGLLQQWQEELREKGGLLVPRWESGLLYRPDGCHEKMDAAEALAHNALLLLSREWARLPNNRELVLNAPVWDLVLLDEAHAARRSKPEEGEFNSANLLLDLLRELQLRQRARGLLLLSATPMQTQPWEPWDLLGVLGIGAPWLVNFGDVRAYYQGIQELTHGFIGLEPARDIARLILHDAEFPLVEMQRTLGKDILSAAQHSPADHSSALPLLSNALAFATPEQRRHYVAWLRAGAPLGRRMHRNTRDTLRDYHRMGLLPTAPAQRQVHDVIFDYQEWAERECYDAIEEYINKRYEQLEAEKKGKGFVMTVYRRRAASSPLALRRSLERRREKLDRVIRHQWTDAWLDLDEEQIAARDLSDADIDEQIDPAVPSNPQLAALEKRELDALLGRLDGLGATDSKLAQFWETLQAVTADGRAVLVFTEYADTLEYLREQLRPTYGHTLGCYSGEGGKVWDGHDWATVSKAEITARLSRGQLKVLVCTDAASEGLNLQAASALINYDLPWNPSRIEQRIGRIDRIGQQQSTLPIRNLFLTDSVDMDVYQVLRERCGLFEHFVGQMQPVLALARDVLRRNPRRGEAADIVARLRQAAQEIEKDELLAGVFSPAAAAPLPSAPAPLTRADLETALTWLADTAGKVTARRDSKIPTLWHLKRLPGMGRRSSIPVTLDRETLERQPDVLPLTLHSDLLVSLVESLPLPGHVPLVLEEFLAGPYRCVEARWVWGDQIVPIDSAQHLLALIETWDGAPVSPALRLQAQDAARAVAQQRVAAMQRAAQEEVRAALQRQHAAAQARLRRELARTLRCLSDAPLDAALHQQVQRETDPRGRYHQALKRLGGYPLWIAEELQDAETYVAQAAPHQIKARLALSEIDAALGDPRWRAQRT